MNAMNMGHHCSRLEDLVQKPAPKQPVQKHMNGVKHMKPGRGGLTHSEMSAFIEADFFTDIAEPRWGYTLRPVIIPALLALLVLVLIGGVVWW